MATVLVAVVVLRLSRPVTMPIVAGALIATMAWPVRTWCERFMPRPLALLATVLLIVAVAVSLIGAIGWSGARVAERIVERRDRLEALHRRASDVVAPLGVELPALPRRPASGSAPGADSAAAPPRPSAGGERSLAARFAAAVFSGFGALGLTIGFAALALAEARDARERVRRRFDAATGARTLEIWEEVAGAVRRYVAVKSLTSAITGATTLLITLAFGLDFAIVWGGLTFLLEFVPTVGSVLAVIPPALFALVHFDSLGRPLALTAALTAAQLTLGNYVDPRIEGRMLSLSPFAVLASIVLWAWIWGAPGALLGVPITVALVTVARHFEGTRWLWALLGSGRDAGEREANGSPGK